jgi:hypothetical protein
LRRVLSTDGVTAEPVLQRSLSSASGSGRDG